MISNCLEIGNKVDIRILQEVLRGYSISEKPHIYKSQIYDIISEDEIVLGMPIEASKIVLLPVDIRYDLCFYTSSGLYNCTATIKDRYKSDNIYVISMEIKSQLSKYQRREYYRMECLVNFNYYCINDLEELELKEPKSIEDYHLKNYPDDKLFSGIVVDISGGGIRSVCLEPVEPDSNILMFFRLDYSDVIHNFVVIGHVISCQMAEKSRDKKYEVRIEFLDISKREREIIIKYIFEEDRRKRKNEKV